MVRELAALAVLLLSVFGLWLVSGCATAVAFPIANTACAPTQTAPHAADVASTARCPPPAPCECDLDVTPPARPAARSAPTPAADSR